MTCACEGYLNWKPYVEFVYVSQSLVGGMGVRVDETGVAVGAIHANVDIICTNKADSATLSKTGGGVGKFPALTECRTKSMLMQALFLRVE